jgi:outer membrane protein OmpA-like peptidoglycan-associated protein
VNARIHHFRTLTVTVAASLLLAACVAGPTKPEGAADARAKLSRLQSDPQLASRAPLAIKDAEVAVLAAEQPTQDADLSRHLVFIADRKVETASAQAHARLSEDQRKGLSEQREGARLDSRTREADAARSDANAARADADVARSQAGAALATADASRQQAEDLQRQLTELNAKATDRGFVVTLGDVLFATGRSELKGGDANNLAKLAGFLNKYQDRSVAIEGHTDNVGSENSNLALSQRRADSVKSYLVGQGIASGRLMASGKGEGSPVAGNDSFTGRQQNRRVEVIISNTVTSSR